MDAAAYAGMPRVYIELKPQLQFAAGRGSAATSLQMRIRACCKTELQFGS